MKKYLCIAVALLAVTACKNDENPSGEDPAARLEIRLSSGIRGQIRAFSPKQSTLIAGGEKVYVWADEKNESYFKAWELISNGAGGFHGADKRYYPSSGNPVDFYAIHGNFITAGEGIAKDVTDFPAGGITHTVAPDQRQAGHYEKSDLLYASHQEVSRTHDPVKLQFYHLLSKVEIAIRPGEGLTLETLQKATVSVLNTNTSVRFTPEKLSAEAMREGTNRRGMVQAVGSTIREITLPTAAVENTAGDFTGSDSYGEAIMVPQPLEAQKQFIKVTLENDGELFYTLPSAVTFESGKKYIYRITVNLTGLEVEAEIEPWTPGTENTGDAEMQ